MVDFQSPSETLLRAVVALAMHRPGCDPEGALYRGADIGIFYIKSTHRRQRLCAGSSRVTGAGGRGRSYTPGGFPLQEVQTAEVNYDREVLAIVVALKEWEYVLKSCKEDLMISTDHKIESISLQVLSRRQARWAESLAHF